ncbi:unnamed protein product [Vicia faba]|uniref:Uncharacterized protein n=1 Tax=Vicia faba TaxID=3906 RepID=A0AAV1B8C2_VICFA|nr:unnamed protein product [Vicia faba]
MFRLLMWLMLLMFESDKVMWVMIMDIMEDKGCCYENGYEKVNQMVVQEAAQKTINSIGLGFDIPVDTKFENYRSIGSPLIFINKEQRRCRDLEIPGAVTVPNFPNSTKCAREDSISIHLDVLTSDQLHGLYDAKLVYGDLVDRLM